MPSIALASDARVWHRGCVSDLFANLPSHSAGSRFAAFDLHSEIGIAGHRLIIPHIPLDRALQPSDWFASKFANGSVHEPRLVDLLVELSVRLAGRPVRFYDIGALFGFFGILAGKLFAGAELVAVEPDREAARYVAALARANGCGADVKQVLLTGQAGAGSFAAQGFRYLADPSGPPIQTAALEDILLPRRDGLTEILKIDTEGYQARFLPQAADELAQRQAIVLLELDRPEKLAAHGSSNAAVVAPFLALGYTLYWCDHRDPCAKLERLPDLVPRHERNSLAVLIPRDFDAS